MNEQFLAFSKINGLGLVTLKKIMNAYKVNGLRSIYDTNSQKFLEKLKITAKQKASIKDVLESELFEQYLFESKCLIHKLLKKGIHIVSYHDYNYPKYLKLLDDAPAFLFCKGNLELLTYNKNVAVVGTRNNTEYGQLITQKTVQFLVENEYCIVSGLALGIDTIAHKSTLEFKGKTIAVLVDVDNIVPKTNLSLANAILDNGGLLLTENAPNSKIIPPLFAKRDRIQTGLSLGVFPIEAGLNSGTFHAINTGLKYNRTIFAPDVYRSGYKDINIDQLEGIKSIIDKKQAFAYTKAEYTEILNILVRKQHEVDIDENSQPNTQSEWKF